MCVRQSKWWLKEGDAFRRAFQAKQDEKQSQIVIIVSHLKQEELVGSPGRKPEPKVSEEASPDDGLLVAERLERELAVVTAESTATHSSKWEAIRSILHITCTTNPMQLILHVSHVPKSKGYTLK